MAFQTLVLDCVCFASTFPFIHPRAVSWSGATLHKCKIWGAFLCQIYDFIFRDWYYFPWLV